LYGLAVLGTGRYGPPHDEPGHAGRERLIERHRKAMASMAVNELGKMLTASEVAEMLHLHVNTVKRLGDRGELKYYKVCKRGDRRFLLEDVRRFLDQNR
jgi:excisionase family DNA binding protein